MFDANKQKCVKSSMTCTAELSPAVENPVVSGHIDYGGSDDDDGDDGDGDEVAAAERPDACVRDCAGLPDGNYQSCRGCNVYASCRQGELSTACKHGVVI